MGSFFFSFFFFVENAFSSWGGFGQGWGAWTLEALWKWFGHLSPLTVKKSSPVCLPLLVAFYKTRRTFHIWKESFPEHRVTCTVGFLSFPFCFERGLFGMDHVLILDWVLKWLSSNRPKSSSIKHISCRWKQLTERTVLSKIKSDLKVLMESKRNTKRNKKQRESRNAVSCLPSAGPWSTVASSFNNLRGCYSCVFGNTLVTPPSPPKKRLPLYYFWEC